MAGQPSAVGAGPLDPDAHHRAEGSQPAQQPRIAVVVRRERRLAQQAPRGGDRGGDMDVFVGVDLAEDSDSVC